MEDWKELSQYYNLSEEILPTMLGDIIQDCMTDIDLLDDGVHTAMDKIESLDTSVGEANEDIENLNTGMSEIQTDITELKGSVSTAQSDISTLYSSDQTINTELQNLGGRISVIENSPLKREIMASYGYFGIEWDLDALMHLVKWQVWGDFAIGDYFIDTTTTGEQIMWEIAGKNSYLHCGDVPLEKPHIVCCPRDCLETYYKYNSSDTNAGGYAASLMPENLETEAEKFTTKLQGYMTQIQRLENNKGAWAWAYRRIFLPGNPELVGFHGFADMWDGGTFNQLPLFVGGNAHLLKGVGFNKKNAARMWYWTADPSATSSTSFCIFSRSGGSNYYNASSNIGVAPLIVLS